MNNQSTLCDTGCFLFGGNNVVKPRMIKSFSQIILRTVKRNDIVRGILGHYNEELQERRK